MIKLKIDGKGLGNKLRRAFETVVDTRGQLAAQRLHSAIVLNTPIRTGYARSRWTLDIKDTYTVRYSVAYRPGVFFREFNYVISNDAPYIIYLNRGSSKQAPPYFIEQTIMSQGFSIKSAVVS